MEWTFTRLEFTVCCLSEDRAIQETGAYPTTAGGYKSFIMRMSHWNEEGCEVRSDVESTGNTRRFRNRLVRAGVVETLPRRSSRFLLR